MSWFRRFRPSPALVVASLALLIALGGTGYAATRLPRNSVTTVQVKDFSLLGATSNVARSRADRRDLRDLSALKDLKGRPGRPGRPARPEVR